MTAFTCATYKLLTSKAMQKKVDTIQESESLQDVWYGILSIKLELLQVLPFVKIRPTILWVN